MKEAIQLMDLAEVSLSESNWITYRGKELLTVNKVDRGNPFWAHASGLRLRSRHAGSVSIENENDPYPSDDTSTFSQVPFVPKIKPGKEILLVSGPGIRSSPSESFGKLRNLTN